MSEVILDAVLDSLKVLPFLFLTYVIIEVIEVKGHIGFKHNKLLGGKFGPLIGTGVGVVPQCGFSVMATNLFAERHISVGTLLAVYVATSDEAVPILLGNVTNLNKLWPLILCKIILALIVGYGADLIFRRRQTELITVEQCEAHEHEAGEHDDDGHEKHKHEEGTVEQGCCHHDLNAKNGVKAYVLHPLKHSLKICLYILIVNVLIGTLVHFVGEEKIASFLSATTWAQPVLSALVGLIPNCASSVVITQLYVMDALTLGAAVAGLSVNAGIAVAVLFKQNKNQKQNLFIVSSLFLISVIAGYVINVITL